MVLWKWFEGSLLEVSHCSDSEVDTVELNTCSLAEKLMLCFPSSIIVNEEGLIWIYQPKCALEISSAGVLALGLGSSAVADNDQCPRAVLAKPLEMLCRSGCSA